MWCSCYFVPCSKLAWGQYDGGWLLVIIATAFDEAAPSINGNRVLRLRVETILILSFHSLIYSIKTTPYTRKAVNDSCFCGVSALWKTNQLSLNRQLRQAGRAAGLSVRGATVSFPPLQASRVFFPTKALLTPGSSRGARSSLVFAFCVSSWCEPCHYLVNDAI